ncbi:MAG: energy transducer TonB, partial [Silanimonas sp.]
ADAQALADAQAQADAARLAAEAQRTEASRRDATPGAADATVRPTPPATNSRPAPTTGAATAPAPAARPPPTRAAPAATAARPTATNPPSTPPSPGTATTARALLQRVPPRFPEAAARRRLEGSVEVRVSIAADGRVENVDVIRADPPGVFDREAVLAVRRWRYAPADAPSEARVVLTFKRP